NRACKEYDAERLKYYFLHLAEDGIRVRNVTGVQTCALPIYKPIKFIGTGEKMEAIDIFHPDRMADRILGMGDVISLVERAQEQYDEQEARKIQKKIAKNQFGFDDFLKQIQQVKKMGNMKDLMGMIPGAGKMMKNIDIDDDAFKGIESIIHSMTPEERAKPQLINSSRKKRISKGSGTTVTEVNQLLKQ